MGYSNQEWSSDKKWIPNIEGEKKKYNIEHMGQETATAHSDRSPNLAGSETEGNTGESTTST